MKAITGTNLLFENVGVNNDRQNSTTLRKNTLDRSLYKSAKPKNDLNDQNNVSSIDLLILSHILNEITSLIHKI